MDDSKLFYRRLYKNQGDKISYLEGWAEKDGLVVMQHAKSLDGKATKRSYLAQPKNVGKSNETTPVEQALYELDSRSKKKIDKGYVRLFGEIPFST